MQIMKKFLLVSLLLFSVFSIRAQQRCAVLDFQVGSYVTPQDIEGISYMFRSSFLPSGYTMLERHVINGVIRRLDYDPTDMTHQEVLKVGRELTANKIVVGTVSKFMDEYSVEVRVIDVSKGSTVASESENFIRTDYRSAMEKLSKKLLVEMGSSAPAESNSTAASASSVLSQERTEPYVLYGYLKVFPKDLGTFSSVPKTVIAQLNQSTQYGYGTWRLPTEEEIALMRDNKIIGHGNYMTAKNKTGIVRLVTDKAKGEILPAIPAGYVDLGLPSGTLWKDKNESGFYTYEQALNRFGKNLPSKDDFEELKNACQWSWTGGGYRVTGPSGESIYLPASGMRTWDGGVVGAGSGGYYWSSTPNSSDIAWYFLFNSSGVGNFTDSRSYGWSVRLVQVL